MPEQTQEKILDKGRSQVVQESKASAMLSIDRFTISERIAAYRSFQRRCCASDYRMKQIISKGKPLVFDRIRFKAGSVVRSEYVGVDALWLVVGHGFTGECSNERGCYACKVTDRVFKRWQWIGPESMIRRA